jgi:hypothetical protein
MLLVPPGQELLMKNHLAFLAGLVVLAGCADAPTATSAATDADAAAPSFAWGVDSDGDGLDDGTEWDLANQFAPVLYMPNLITRAEAGAGVAGDWTWPSTVSWYLPQIRMRIHHNNCSDHQLLDVGQVNSTNILQQSHQRYVRNWYGTCSHESPWQYSNGSWHNDDHYFLQAGNDDAVHPGIRDPGAWQTYFHAYRNTIGGVSIQYWFFYAYNDFVGSANHEGDWEHINVRLNASNQVDGIWYAQHNGAVHYYPGDVSWFGTHPQVWVADGSHASYRSESDCDYAFNEGLDGSCWTNSYQRWFTWGGGDTGEIGLRGGALINMGEQLSGAKHPMPGQDWVRYSGRWGEVGTTSATSGPRGPGYQANWTRELAP